MAQAAFRQNGERDIPVFGDNTTARTANLPDVTVNFREPLRAGGSMEPIDILCDEPEGIVRATFKFYKSDVGRIRLLRGNQFTPPVVPFPDQPRVSLKGFGCCEIFRAVGAPQAVRPAKGRHAAIRRNSSSREDGYVPSGSEVCAGEEDLMVSSHGRMGNYSGV